MSKRDGGGGASGANKKRKYVQGHGIALRELGPGLRGALITCDVHVEKDAIRETFRLLEALTETLEPAATDLAVTPAAATASSATAGDALARELAELQAERAGEPSKAKPTKRFSVAQTDCGGSVFIRFDDPALDPVAVVDRVMEQALANRRSGAPHVVRMLPVQATCSARTVATLAETAEPLMQKSLAGYAGTYAVHWRRRFNKVIDKMEVINAVAKAVEAVAPKATVDLTQAEAVCASPPTCV